MRETFQKWRDSVSIMLARGFARAFSVGFLVSLGASGISVACGVPSAEFDDPDASISPSSPESGGAAVVGSSGGEANAAGGAAPISEGSGGELAAESGGAGTRPGPVTRCTSSQDCAPNRVLRSCDVGTGRCVECLPTEDSCGKGLYCNGNSECVLGCQSAKDCPGGACSEDHHLCGACQADTDCLIGSHCDTNSGSCIAACLVQSDCPTGWDCCDGTCAHIDLSEENCGACGKLCQAVHAPFSCLEGACVVEKCDSGWGDCNAEVVGCETDLKSTLTHCGRCDLACSGDLVCVDGLCTVGQCTAPFKDCDGKPSNGCEANVSADVSNCGECGVACDSTQGVAACQKGNCSIACNTGWGDCDANASSGCEVNLTSSLEHCGRCGGACSNAHGTTRCASGDCSPICAQGFGDCDGNPRNGCEANLSSDSASCGACGTSCSLVHADSACQSGKCAILGCKEGWIDCDGDPSNGCEVNPASNPSNCGGCGKSCSGNNGTATCSSGTCGTTCSAGFADCDGNSSNGCEEELGRSVLNCGKCGAVCSDAGGTPSCQSGNCLIDKCSDPYANCDGKSTNGCEANTLQDPQNCGACGHVCFADHGTAVCREGVCQISACAPDFADCDQRYSTGCEASLKTNDNCGACAERCAPPNAIGSSCATGSCRVTACTEPFKDCDDSSLNGCEMNLQTDASHCGGCGTVCSSNHGDPSCRQGVCAIACSSGFGDCDGMTANGCEQPLTDIAHCGSCTNACSSHNGAPSCSNGSCLIQCQSEFGNCNGSVADGCETQLSTVGHCGSCGNDCGVANGTGQCLATTTGHSCAVGACSPPYADCDGTYSNGCETNVSTSAVHCGRCNAGCSFANGAALCKAGTCALDSCQKNFGDCDGDVSNGCESNLLSSLTHCSSCARSCTGDFPHSTGLCSGGACQVGPCLAGYGDCDGKAATGCEVNLLADGANCGACGVQCQVPRAVGACGSGQCSIKACETGWADCNKAYGDGCEVNVDSSVRNCGACGHACSSEGGTPNCNKGTCEITACTDSYGNCDGKADNGCETNLRTSNANCGECGTTCQAANSTAACNAGKCELQTCSTGFADCNGTYSDGCEINVGTNPNYCGDCKTVCSSVNGVPLCSAGKCGIACSAGFGNCDNLAANGCETNLGSSLQNCGACGKACSFAHASAAACDAGACVMGACAAGYANCDGDPSNGCEVALQSSATNCGACGRACSYSNASGVCQAGACALGTCNSGYADCDKDPRNGCEVNVNASVDNCGGCGQSCGYPNGAAVCVAGRCSLDRCADGYGNCDQTASNGCEALFSSNAEHCGSCTTSCLTTYPHAGGLCQNGGCSMGACEAGWADCNSSASDGCESSLLAVSDCGSCGNECTNGHGTTSCGQASCAPVCASGWGDCDASRNNGCERNLTLPTSCGSCGLDCTGAFAHATATCQGAPLGCALGFCDYLYGDCDGKPANGCELPLSSDPLNCGSCGTQCENAHGTSQCIAGGCSPSCSRNFGNCDGNAQNGCEKDLSQDPNNCGGCSVKCDSTAPFCVDGSCSTHLQIEVVNSSTVGGTNGPDVSVSHLLQTPAKNRRMVLAAVATVGNGGCTPNSVTYNGRALALAKSSYSGNQAWAGIYTLLDVNLPAVPGAYDLVVDNPSACMNVVTNVLELKNVDQTKPLGGVVGGASISCVASDTLAVGTTDAWVYDLVSDFGSLRAPVTSLGVAKSLTFQREQTNTNHLTGVGGFAGPLAPGSQLTGWTMVGCNTAAHVVVEIRPAEG